MRSHHRRPVPFFATATVAAVASLATLGACSHEQKPPASSAAMNTPRTRTAPPPAGREVATEAPPMSRDVSAPKDPAVFFDFDSAVLNEAAHPVLQHVAGKVESRSDEKVRIEGNCDELGTVEYNLALGEHRARAAKDYLVHLGVPRNRIVTISYGSQRPKYAGDDATDRAKNRRDDLFVIR